ncbi:MAG TPA: aminoglycoside phosphotransferase family protein [Roseiflexaceae bacterium]|nr:aminoglycoside phosphotransferase family protein [Roseiflexaceae bacterium]HMP42486.1 aminoglycoside phosphotransferase family protein [Roseiflexaceae bacterium]
MLEPPDTIDLTRMTDRIHEAYGMRIVSLNFLPLGADLDTAVYQASTADGADWFVKLRGGNFNTASVVIPHLLHQQGVAEVIAPLATGGGDLTTQFGEYTMIVYPFIAGRDGYVQALSEAQWHAFGRTLGKLHRAIFPASIRAAVPREQYDPTARHQLRWFLANPAPVATDALAIELAEFLVQRHAAIHELVERAERLAGQLRQRDLPLVVCHGDLHAGNVLLSDDGRFFIVDWDTLIEAPCERDLMFFGGAQGFIGYQPEEETALFAAGYGSFTPDTAALAYYRYERIIQDMAIYCEQLLLSDAGGANRIPSLFYFKNNFRRGGTIERAAIDGDPIPGTLNQ